MDEGGSRIAASQSEGFLCGEPGVRVILLGTLKDMLIKALDLVVCFHMDRAFVEHELTLLFYGL